MIHGVFFRRPQLTIGHHWFRWWLGPEEATSHYMKWWWPSSFSNTRWRHQMETFSALLVLCAGNSPVPGQFPEQRPVTRSFDVFFDLRLNKRLSKQSWGWWFETLSRPLWRHCNVRASPDLFELNQGGALIIHVSILWLHVQKHSSIAENCVIWNYLPIR